MKLSKCHFFLKEIEYLGHVHSTTGINPLPSKTAAIKVMNPPKNAKHVRAFLGLVGFYCKFIKNFAHITKCLTALTHYDVKFSWTSSHLKAFNTLKSTLLEAPILYYPDPSKCYIVYMDASDDACGAMLSQEHDGQELPVDFFSHTFTDTQWKWSTREQEVYGIYYAVTKWNYYLQGSHIVVCNDHKSLQKFLNGKNANNNCKQMVLKLATYNITFEWISSASNKADDCISGPDVMDTPATPTAMIHMLVTSTPDGPHIHTCRKHVTLPIPHSLQILQLYQLMTR